MDPRQVVAHVIETLTLEQLATAASFAVVAVAIAAERLWLHACDGDARLRPLATAAAMMAGAMLVGTAATGLLHSIWSTLAQWSPAPVASLVAAHPVVELVVAFVAWDAAGYLHHRIGHASAVGWASHQVHHTGTHYDLSLAWRQSWLPWPALVVYPLVTLTGVSFGAVALCAAISNTWQALNHMSVPLRSPRPLDRWLVTPATHRVHHESRHPVNLGPVLTVWDRLAGTWVPAPAPWPDDRLARPVATANPIALELAGWRVLLTPHDLRAAHAAEWTIGHPFRPNNGG